MADEFLSATDDGALEVSFHRHQERAWDSIRRFVAVLAGTQGGKTCFGPLWLHREIMRCGPGDYMVVSPTFKLLSKKALPEFLRLFRTYLRLGTYNKTDQIFTVSPEGEIKLFGKHQSTPTLVHFGYAENPDSLESATALAAWLDEAGQKAFKLESWEAILRRLSLNMGRALITTTWYNLGWLYTKIWQPWKSDDPDIEVVRFPSNANPAFPQAEWERAKRDLPGWKFDLYYRGIPTRPAGIIYPDTEICPPFTVPRSWPRYIGIDFGGVNTAAGFYAKEPDSRRWYLYREYKKGERTAAEHVKAMLAGEPFPHEVRGGSKSEGQWRAEFRAAGLPVKGPRVSDVEVGIDRVWGMHNRREIVVFSTCERYLEEKGTYSRKLNDNGDPTEEIEDKNSFHFMDQERYIMGAQHTTARSKPPTSSRATVTM